MSWIRLLTANPCYLTVSHFESNTLSGARLIWGRDVLLDDLHFGQPSVTDLAINVMDSPVWNSVPWRLASFSWKPELWNSGVWKNSNLFGWLDRLDTSQKFGRKVWGHVWPERLKLWQRSWAADLEQKMRQTLSQGIQQDSRNLCYVMAM